MENISRALIIVGGMLLAILVLTLLVFLFNKLSIIPAEQTQQHSEFGIIEFNRSFEVYQKPLMYGTDIISVINKAIDHNMNNGLLHSGSNFFSKAFTNPITGELMSIEAKLKSSEEELELFTRVRIYYIVNESGQLREKEYNSNDEIEGHTNDTIGDVLPGKNYEALLNASGIDLTKEAFFPAEYIYTYDKGFMKIEGGEIVLFAGDANQDVQANKDLMRFLKTEPITIVNPKPKEDTSWSRLVITPASSKLKRLIFKSINDKTEYYQNGRIKQMYFEEK